MPGQVDLRVRGVQDSFVISLVAAIYPAARGLDSWSVRCQVREEKQIVDVGAKFLTGTDLDEVGGDDRDPLGSRGGTVNVDYRLALYCTTDRRRSARPQ